MTSTPRSAKSVCVVIVNYNSGATLIECVRSLLASTIPVNIIVSDNGSDDNSLVDLRAWLRASIPDAAQVSIIENRRNLGFANANNIALVRCRNDYVLLLNPDCVVEPDMLEKMIEVMEQHPEAGMASAFIFNPDGSEQAGCRRFVPTPWRSMVRVLHLQKVIRNHPRFQSFTMTGLPLPDAPEPVEAISGAFMFLRREAFEAVGLMDGKYFLHCEDLDWCMRFRQAGWKILFVPHVRVMHWKGMSSKTHPILVEYHKHRGMVRFYNKFFRHQYPGPLMVIVVMAVWMRFLLKTGWILSRKILTPAAKNRDKSRFWPESGALRTRTGEQPESFSSRGNEGLVYKAIPSADGRALKMGIREHIKSLSSQGDAQRISRTNPSTFRRRNAGVEGNRSSDYL